MDGNWRRISSRNTYSDYSQTIGEYEFDMMVTQAAQLMALNVRLIKRLITTATFM